MVQVLLTVAVVQISAVMELLEQGAVVLIKEALVQLIAVAVVVVLMRVRMAAQVAQELLFLNTQILLQFHNQD